MSDEIRVRVVGPKDRPFYQLRAFRGKRCFKTKSTTIENTGRKREKTAADRAAAVWEDELKDGRYRDPSKVTWEEFEEAYLDAAKEDDKAKSTIDGINTTFKLVRDILHPDYLRDVTTERLIHWKKELGKGRAQSTVGKWSRHLNAALHWAAEDGGLIPEAPKLKVPKCSGRKSDPVTREEHAAILAHVEEVIPSPHVDAWRFFLRGLWYSGLRSGEALKLSWEPLSPVAVITRPGEEPVLRFQPKGHKARRAETTPVAPDFADMLLAVPEDRREGKVFRLLYRTQPLGFDRVAILFGEITEKAGVPQVHFHDYRRAFGTRMVMEEEATVFELMKLMRHKDIKTTLKYYLHLDAQAITGNLRRRRTGKRGESGNRSGNKAAENAVILGVS